MIKREIEIDGKPVTFKASAAVPRLYRAIFQRDIFRDLLRIQNSFKDQDGEESNIPIRDLELFENVAYVMAKHADPSQPDTPDEWLDQFDTFSIYSVMPQLIELWHFNLKTDIEAKKNRNQVSGK